LGSSPDITKLVWVRQVHNSEILLVTPLNSKI
jgi:hypothetical protein